jgi:hypothetical protein
MNRSETRTASKASGKDWLVPIAGLGFVVAYFGARLIFEITGLSRPLYFVAALLPAVAFLVFVWALAGLLRSGDEMQRRIQLEALAIAWPLAVAIVMTLSLLQKAGFLGWEPMWAYLPMTYYLGLMVAWRRYQ